MENVYPGNDYRNFLEHHGISGQKWGVRKAPWYPISAFKDSVKRAGKKVSDMRSNYAEKRKARKAEKEEARKAAQKKKDEELQRKFEEDKEKVLRTGTPGEIMKLAPHLTTKELQDAITRNQALENLKNAEKKRISDIEEAEFEAKYAKLNNIARNVRKGIELASVGIDAYNKVQDVMDLINGTAEKAKTAPSVAEILANPRNFTDAQVQAALNRQRNIDAMQPKKKEKTPSVQDILNNPDAYDDDQVQAALNRQRNIDSMRPKMKSKTPSAEDVLRNPSAYSDDEVDAAFKRDQKMESMRKNHPADNVDTGTSEKTTKSDNVNTSDKTTKSDNTVNKDRKPDVVDGEYKDISDFVNPENISTALTVVSKGINAYQTVKRARSGQKLLEQREYFNLILEPGVDDDANRRR